VIQKLRLVPRRGAVGSTGSIAQHGLLHGLPQPLIHQGHKPLLLLGRNSSLVCGYQVLKLEHQRVPRSVRFPSHVRLHGLDKAGAVLRAVPLGAGCRSLHDGQKAMVGLRPNPPELPRPLLSWAQAAVRFV